MTTINNIIKNRTVSVWTEVPDGINVIKDERENIFNTMEDAMSFIQGNTVKNYVNKEVQIKANERIALVEMNIVFDEQKLVQI